MVSSPGKAEHRGSDEEATSPPALTPRAGPSVEIANIVEPPPAQSTFFEDEMSVRDEMQSALEPADDIFVDERNFTPIDVVEEDLALAEEAEEMSLLEAEEIEEREAAEQAMEMLMNTEHAALADTEDNQILLQFQEIHSESVEIETTCEGPYLTAAAEEAQSFEETNEQIEVHLPDEHALSEASQEYGDENAIPIDPVLLAMPAAPTPVTPTFKTPRRVLGERVCHTVSKVPLKAAAEDSPMRPSSMNRSASISRIPAGRPSSNLARSNTVIAYSPTKSSRRTRPQTEQEEDVIMKEASATPLKSEAVWSNMGTPARTPRRDLNPALLTGAVVFVDVYTSEGADASSLFIELLTQMGARCVKTWSWNSISDDESKIGITHVVFKDGGKRTLEKAKETGGVVSCVGVGWVLEYGLLSKHPSTLN